MIKKRLYILMLSGVLSGALALPAAPVAVMANETDTNTVSASSTKEEYEELEDFVFDYEEDEDCDGDFVSYTLEDYFSENGNVDKLMDEDENLDDQSDVNATDQSDPNDSDESGKSFSGSKSFSSSKDISKSEATKIAKNNAKKNYKIKTSTIRDLEAKKDKYKGKSVWEVSFEAKTKSSSHYYEFEYQILRSTGKILHREKEWD